MVIISNRSNKAYAHRLMYFIKVESIVVDFLVPLLTLTQREPLPMAANGDMPISTMKLLFTPNMTALEILPKG
jgi:hypothetical protein